MGKATRIRQQNAREKIAAQREAERRAEMRRRLFITAGSVLGVIVIVVSFIVFKSLKPPPAAQAGGATGTALPASVINDITNVPASTLAAVGKGSTGARTVIPITGTPLTSGGKPEVVYIGATRKYQVRLGGQLLVAQQQAGSDVPGFRAGERVDVGWSMADVRVVYKH